ncbi:MAG: 5-formyltetrahydrofolate cyclo-ligase [Burkholderiaceae bacterium]|nr:5-formyltetrahydrofolate cyclo-ligase [Burkholderiaceae bacterium]
MGKQTPTPPAGSPTATATATDAPRVASRSALLAARGALADRTERATVLANRVARWLNTVPLTRLGFFWPIRGEPDLAPVVVRWLAADAKRRAALPVVEGDRLAFAPWTPGMALQSGRFDIPVPPGTARLSPQLMLIPCVGFDDARYRLGYGGGFYDRTLGALAVRPVMVGVAFDCGRVASIDPQPHDIRLDLVITESGVL